MKSDNEIAVNKSAQNAKGYENFVNKYYDNGKNTEFYADPKNYVGGSGQGQSSGSKGGGGGGRTSGGIDSLENAGQQA